MAKRNPNLLITDEAAPVVGLHPTTLATWRCTKEQRIPYLKIGRRVYYRRSDLESWLDRQVVDGGQSDDEE